MSDWRRGPSGPRRTRRRSRRRARPCWTGRSTSSVAVSTTTAAARTCSATTPSRHLDPVGRLPPEHRVDVVRRAARQGLLRRRHRHRRRQVRGLRLRPGSDAWTRVADLPLDMWGSAYSVVDDRLVVVGGAAVDSSAVTNEGYAYDAVTDSWSALPPSRYAFFRASGACGFTKIGGKFERLERVRLRGAAPRLRRLPATTDFPWVRTTPRRAGSALSTPLACSCTWMREAWTRACTSCGSGCARRRRTTCRTSGSGWWSGADERAQATPAGTGAEAWGGARRPTRGRAAGRRTGPARSRRRHVARDVAHSWLAMPRRVVGLDVLGQAVDDRLGLRLEGAEQLVPDDQDAAVVAVEVAAVGAVVDPVVRRGVEHLLERADAADRLGVDPELVDQVEGAGLLDDRRADAERGRAARTGPRS